MLKPGGRLAIGDVVTSAPMPPELASDKALLCGCVAGAAARGTRIEGWLSARPASSTSPSRSSRKAASISRPGPPAASIENYVASATIEARKPAA